MDLERLASDLDHLRSGRDLHIDSYTFNQPGVSSERLHIPACPVVFLDGLFLLYDEGVRSRLHLTVYIHATPETRLARRMARDQAERSLAPDMIQYNGTGTCVPETAPIWSRSPTWPMSSWTTTAAARWTWPMFTTPSTP